MQKLCEKKILYSNDMEEHMREDENSKTIRVRQVTFFKNNLKACKKDILKKERSFHNILLMIRIP